MHRATGKSTVTAADQLSRSHPRYHAWVQALPQRFPGRADGEGVGIEDPGPPSRRHVLESQRTRLLQALAEVVVGCGLRGATVARVAERAGVSRATFVQHFDDLDTCFLALLEWMLGRGTAVTADAFQREASWEVGVLAGLEALLLFLDAYPVRARACLLGGMTGLPAGFESRAQTLGDLGRLVDMAARRQLALERQPPASMAEATVASVVGILRRRLLGDEAPPFVALDH